MRQFYVYILASKSRVLYVGVTNDLARRVFQHRTETTGFTARYHIGRLVYFEVTQNPTAAITREKQIKRWLRSKKLALVTAANPTWTDLASDWEHPSAAAPAASDRRAKADSSLRSE